MRIAMISTPFLAVPPRDYGGTELVVSDLVEALLDRGHDVTLFATGDSRTRARLRALYPAPQWPPGPYTDLNHISWAMSQAASGGFEVIHAHSAVALAAGRLIPGLPLVYTIHHTQDEALSDYYRHFPQVAYVAISADQARREPGVERCTVIHHGLDVRRYHWTDQPDAYVCFLARFAPEKGTHTAIDVAARAGVPIRVAGEVHPPNREYYRAEVEPRLGLPHVTYLGCVGNDRKIPLLRGARALLAPIDWHEPFGLMFVEAMLSGCPVVTFGRGSVPEIVEPGVTGFIARSPEEMARLIRPGGPLDQLDRGRIRAHAMHRFSRERMAADYERVYLAAATRGRPGTWRPITAA